MSERRPWKRAIAWIVLLGAFFFASYAFANWLASRRSDVGSVVFGWEHAIPFLAWTIIPYWSIDLRFGLSLLLCTTRQELDRHGKRLLAAQLISITCFIAFPLRFSFDRPAVDGLFGALFAALVSFDKPFNQAPSLHISLLVVIWVRLHAHCALRWRWVLHTGMTLIGLSILTTYQHHFIDLPTGLAAGFLVLWLVPENADSPLAHLAFTADRARRTLAARYVLGALIFAALACRGGAWLWLFWPAGSLALLASNYAVIGARGFQKGACGRLSLGASYLFAPYVGAAWINSRLWTRHHPAPAEVKDGVSIGRIPTAADLARLPFTAVVDLAAELPCGARTGLIYRSVPVLDLTVPGATELTAAALAIEEGHRRGAVLVCCALGYSRSAAAIIAWLLMTRRAETVEAAMRIVRHARPSIVLTNEHSAALEAFA